MFFKIFHFFSFFFCSFCSYLHPRDYSTTNYFYTNYSKTNYSPPHSVHNSLTFPKPLAYKSLTLPLSTKSNPKSTPLPPSYTTPPLPPSFLHTYKNDSRKISTIPFQEFLWGRNKSNPKKKEKKIEKKSESNKLEKEETIKNNVKSGIEEQKRLCFFSHLEPFLDSQFLFGSCS